MKVKIPPLNLSEAEWKALRLPERALQVAAQLCDVDRVQEEPRGSNRGAWIDTFLTYARTDPGQAWCAAFVTYCVGMAGKNVFSESYGKGVRYPASVVSWVEWARAAGNWSRTPRRGRLFAIAVSGETHIGLVAGVGSDGTFSTIEGNSNVDGSREGYEVCRRVRSVASVSGFIDLGVK